MENHYIKATEGAIEKLVANFQSNPERSWNERDLHWSFFYYLKQENAIQETHVTELIRAELPTLKKFDKARGHYDLVVLDPESFNNPVLQSMKVWEPWDEFLKLIKLMIAVEVKLWLARLPLERADWDIQKLTDRPNNVLNAFFLNFVQLKFSRQHNKDYYRKLREYLMSQKRQWPDLRILCVPNERKMQIPSEDWLSLL